MKRTINIGCCHFLIVLLTGILGLSLNGNAQSSAYNDAVVCSESAYSDNGWKIVADSLVKKHSIKGTSRLFTWRSQVGEVKTALGEFNPDYVAFVARPVTECNTSFVVAVHRLCRALDSDPYGDAVWGIVTGYKAEDALRAISESLTIKTVVAASGNLSYEPPIQRFYQAIGMTCDSYTKTDYLFPGNRGSIYTENQRPENEQDRIKLISKWLSSETVNISVQGKGTISGAVDCIITGGHGNVNVWQCHYSDAGTEGYMQSSAGKLYGAFGSGHAVQMFGFMIDASAGDEFMAWGMYDRVTKQAGMLTLPQGYFIANNNALFEIRNLGNLVNTNLVGTFMDSTAFYGDPAADVHLYSFGDTAHAYKTDLKMTNSSNGLTEFTYIYSILANDQVYDEGYCYQFAV